MDYSQFEFWRILLTHRSGDSLRTPGFLAAHSVTLSKRCKRHHLVGVAGGAAGFTAFSVALAGSSTLAEGENGD